MNRTLNRIVPFFLQHRLLLVYAALAVAMIIFTDGFFNRFNIASILGLGSIMGFMVLGETMVVLTGGIDLSVGNIASFASVMTAWTMITFQNKLPDPVVLVLTVLIGLACGAAVGLINGFAVTRMDIPPLIATLGGFWIAVGFAEFVFSGVPTPLKIQSFRFLGRFKLFGMFPLVFLVFLAFTIVVAVVLTRLRAGRYVYAVGGSREAAYLSGIKTKRVLMFVYLLSGVFSAIGGIFLAAWMNVGDSRGAMGYEFIAITAVVMGGASLFGGQGNLWDSVFGIITLQTIRKIIPHLRISTFYEDGIVGIILLIAVLLNVTGRRRSFQIES
ncbi:MAG: ABC transporter permease [Spirochaetaceae bacterium]|nr:MAG: ABC transporter permease [Spirochaetaceae bacterium]